MKISTLAVMIFSLSLSVSVHSETERAILAGGCFWCVESAFEEVDGVLSVDSGYTGGRKANPTYEEVSHGNSGHIESVEVSFDNKKISYQQILEIFWKNIDPLDPDGQFCDKGDQYKSGVFTLSASQKSTAENSLKALEASERFKGKKITTFIREAKPFYLAEKYHQDYYKKNPLRYKFYRYQCGRDKRLEKVWGK